MPSGADLEYSRLLAGAGISPDNAQGVDGALAKQIGDTLEVSGGGGGGGGGVATSTTGLDINVANDAPVSPSLFDLWVDADDPGPTSAVAQTQAEAESSIDTTPRLTTGQRLFQAIQKHTVWQTYTPILTNWSSSGAGHVLTGRYQLIGKTVHFRCLLILGATFGAPAQGINFSLPLPVKEMVASNNGKYQGAIQGVFTDTGAQNYLALPLIGATTVTLFVLGTNGGAVNPSATMPFTWVTGDFIEVFGTYETV